MAAAAATPYTATEIQAMVRNMDESKNRHADIKHQETLYYEALKTENPVLYDQYPAVFALHIEDKLDDTFFYMLKEKRKMEKGESNEDQSSVRVGQKLFNRWVAPVISNTPAPSSQSYSEYYKSLSKQS
jgi:hypothetical protein